MKVAMNIFEKYDLVDVDESFPIPELPEEGIILLCGSSGSGKTTILRNHFAPVCVEFDNRPIYQNFSSEENAEKLLIACGLRSVPTWLRPYSKLSNGEQHRAMCAKSLDDGVSFIDEFTSVVDRDTAKSLSFAIQKHFRKSKMKRLVISSCHKDIIDWLNPTHVYDTDNHKWREMYLLGRCLWRPSISMDIYPCSVKDWVYFKKHHYLSSELSKSCHCYIGIIGSTPVAFSAVIHGCGRDIRSYWRESRLVVRPEFQGMGIGISMSESVASIYTDRGKRFFSKTAHPALGEFRNKSDKWRETSTNGMKRSSYIKKDGSARLQNGFGKSEKHIIRDSNRVCYSHEYTG
jgi:energy-coupling factor transporter ATP-binding protein EcfA2